MKYVTADEAVKLVRSGDTVCCQGGASVPVLLQELNICPQNKETNLIECCAKIVMKTSLFYVFSRFMAILLQKIFLWIKNATSAANWKNLIICGR